MAPNTAIYQGTSRELSGVPVLAPKTWEEIEDIQRENYNRFLQPGPPGRKPGA